MQVVKIGALEHDPAHDADVVCEGEELADHLEIDREGFVRTVQAYNKACQGGEFNPAVLDGVVAFRWRHPVSDHS